MDIKRIESKARSLEKTGGPLFLGFSASTVLKLIKKINSLEYSLAEEKKKVDFIKADQKPAITLHAVAGECKIEWHGDWSLIEGSQDFYTHPLDPTACKFNK